MVEATSEVIRADARAEGMAEEAAEVAEVAVVVHLKKTIWQRACQAQIGLHYYLKKRRKLRRLTGIRKRMSVPWTLTMRKNNNKSVLCQEIKPDGTRRPRSEFTSSWM